MAALVSGSLTSCANHWTEEQQKSLMALDNNRDGLQSELARTKDQLMDAKSKLASQDKDLNDCNADTQAIMDRLSKWPNIWPDNAIWNPPPPPAPEPTTFTGKAKKHAK